MKKLLLASSALVASAGVVMADGHSGISMTGSAEMGVAAGPEGGAGKNDGDAHFYSNTNIEFTFVGETDNGIEFGASMDASAGAADYDPGDFEFDGPEDGTFGLGSIYISAAGATLTFDVDGTEDLYDDDFDDHDVKLEYSQGPISASLTYDEDNAAGDSEYSYQLSFEQDGFSGSVTGNDLDEQITVAVGYEMPNGLSVGVESDQNGTADTVNTVSASYSIDGLSLAGEVSDDDTWEVSAEYTVDALTAGIVLENDEAYELTGSYNLGGGAQIIAGANDADAYYLGVAMSF